MKKSWIFDYPSCMNHVTTCHCHNFRQILAYVSDFATQKFPLYSVYPWEGDNLVLPYKNTPYILYQETRGTSLTMHSGWWGFHKKYPIIPFVILVPFVTHPCTHPFVILQIWRNMVASVIEALNICHTRLSFVPLSPLYQGTKYRWYFFPLVVLKLHIFSFGNNLN